MKLHKGSCHCEKVIFEVKAPQNLEILECNCSICSLSGYLHLIVPKSRFNLICGTEFLTTYTFNIHTAKHTFCKICGIKPFYVPRSHPDSYSVNLRCLDRSHINQIEMIKFDGQNWEESFVNMDKQI